jgi:hypothetical protein
MPDIDALAEKFVSGVSSGCPYLDELAEGVRRGWISLESMKVAMKEGLNSVI